MQKKKWNVIAPLVLIVFLFSIDKVALLPWFQKCCTEYRGNPFAHSLNYDFSQDAIVNEARKNNKKIILNLGTSRSMGYYQTPTPEHIFQSKYINENQKKEITKVQIVNSSIPGASILSSYVRLNQWLDHGIQPDAIWVEVSPFSFNQNGLWTWFEIKHAIPWDFALKYAFEMPASHTKKVLTSRLFVTSRYRLGKADKNLSEWEQMFKNVTANLEQIPMGLPHFDGIIEGKEPPDKKWLFNYVASEMKRTMFTNYKVDKTYTQYLYLMIQRAKKENIPIVIWSPASHKIWQKVLGDNKNQGWKKDWQFVINKSKKLGAKYSNMNESGLLKCRYFKDPVHLDVRCFLEMVSHKLPLSGL